MEIKKVGVAGCGLMGHGITQVSAEAGYEVVVTELDQDRLDAGDRQQRGADLRFGDCCGCRRSFHTRRHVDQPDAGYHDAERVGSRAGANGLVENQARGF